MGLASRLQMSVGHPVGWFMFCSSKGTGPERSESATGVRWTSRLFGFLALSRLSRLQMWWVAGIATGVTFSGIQLVWQLTELSKRETSQTSQDVKPANRIFFWMAAAGVCSGRSALQSAEQRCQRRYGHKHQMTWYVIQPCQLQGGVEREAAPKGCKGGCHQTCSPPIQFLADSDCSRQSCHLEHLWL